MEQNKDKKLYLLMGILIILILIVLRSLITSQNDAIIDYDEITSGIDIALQGSETKEREIYYIAEDILFKFKNSYIDMEQTGVTVEDYYEVLNKTYKNKISKSKYLELVDNFFSKLKIIDNSGMGVYTTIQTHNVIRSIYDIGDDAYICVLGLPDAFSYSYLGIKLIPDNNTFEIFYLE